MRAQSSKSAPEAQRQKASVRPKQIAYDLELGLKYTRQLIRGMSKRKLGHHWIFTESEAREIKKAIVARLNGRRP